MPDTFYLPRSLQDKNRTYDEGELLAAFDYIIVLAEPGGGKTELLNSLARQLGTTVVTANVFCHQASFARQTSLVIDALDELAKIDASGIQKLLGRANEVNPKKIILSSRSSEWGSSSSKSFEDFIGQKPTVVRMIDFNEEQQTQIFANYTPDEVFDDFQSEIKRFDLDILLPNPQFLKLFADAYVESGRHFANKRSIFEMAVDRLAREVNPGILQKSAVPVDRKVVIASEIFTNLLLSGADGISISEVNNRPVYPSLSSIVANDKDVESILATRLFKPGESSDEHKPVHKMVSEYCAARYLVSRITNPSDQLRLSMCLPVMAPNSTVRDELRGMLGWMATLGNKPIQQALIKLDPYAVLANGDPSQLEPSSKRQLIDGLIETEKEDPFFRRGDFWRRFSVAGFFTEDVVNELKPLLSRRDDQGHLQGLLLDLLSGSRVISSLSAELQLLLLDSQVEDYSRIEASSRLLEIANYDYVANLQLLIAEASEVSLKISCRIVDAIGSSRVNEDILHDLLCACASLYPGHKERLERTIGSRYFIKQFILKLEIGVVVSLLDKLTEGLGCICGLKHYECDCRNGISKIVGSLLDRFFELSPAPYDPQKIWDWVRGLNFHESKSADDSRAVHVIRTDDLLRQGMIAHAFRYETDPDKIFEIYVGAFGWRACHAGLHLQTQDLAFIVDDAYEKDNVPLWAQFMARHHIHGNDEERGQNVLRRRMKEMAQSKPAFLKVWARSNRATKLSARDWRAQNFRHARSMRKFERRRSNIALQNINYVEQNRALVESGRHWSCLVRFAELLLNEPDNIVKEFGDERLVRNALVNCLDFIKDKIPNLQALADLQCASQGLYVENILYAASLEILRRQGNLDSLSISMLTALRTNLSMGYSAVSEEERESLKVEVDRILFADTQTAEIFLRDYLEPQLLTPKCSHPEVSWLRYDETFKPLQSKLSIDWLRMFPHASSYAVNELFDLAAEFGDRSELYAIIRLRCSELVASLSNGAGDADVDFQRMFWFVRAIYFLKDAPSECWDWLKTRRETVLTLAERSSRSSRSEHSSWPPLSAIQVEAILDAFIGIWPKVHLPSSWGTGSPVGETAYRFLSELIFIIPLDDVGETLPVIDRLLGDARYVDFHKSLRSIRAAEAKKKALIDFEAPSSISISKLLNQFGVITIEGLRSLLVEELTTYQADLDGSETTSKKVFYNGDASNSRLGEVESALRIADRLRLRLEPSGISVTPEHQLVDATRCDITFAKNINGARRLLVMEVKGQWHKELYTALSTQLYEKYAKHPHAESQGIYLVLWFGTHEKIAGKRNALLKTADDLRINLQNQLPSELQGFIDIVVLDLSR